MKLWIDTDAGVDDATAILICLDALHVEIVGISCVGGNASLSNVIKNVNRTCKVYGGKSLDIPIYAGCSRALIQPPMEIPEIHGHDGLGDIKDEDFGINGPHTTKEEHAISALLKAAMDYDDLCILALGPLTNIAVALRMNPLAMQRIKTMFIMGAAEDGNGNTSPYAEFNWRCDPEAAHIVLTSYPQSRIVLSSWTLTVFHQIRQEEGKKIFDINNTLLGRFVLDTWKAILSFTKDIWYMADPIAGFIACYYQLNGVIKEERLNLSVVLEGERIGMSLAEPSENGVHVVKMIDFEMYKTILRKMMSKH